MPKCRILLEVDGIVNLVFGVLILFAPRAAFEALGLPWTERALFPTILGGVLVGIGLGLLLEARRRPGGLVGLGLGAAIAINSAAAVAIAVWLWLTPAPLPLRGQVLLWVLVVFLLGISAAELLANRPSTK